VGRGGGDEHADDGEGLAAVRAMLNAVRGGNGVPVRYDVANLVRNVVGNGVVGGGVWVLPVVADVPVGDAAAG
jgi:hypothetical protein